MTQASDRKILNEAASELLTAIAQKREPNMPEGVTYHISRGSGDCEHEWDGEWKTWENGGSITCSHCGITAMEHDTWIGL